VRGLVCKSEGLGLLPGLGWILDIPWVSTFRLEFWARIEVCGAARTYHGWP